MPIHAMTLLAGDKVLNAEGRTGLVLSLRRDSECNCVAIAWDNHNILLYSRMEVLDVELIEHGTAPTEAQDFLPSAALSSLYNVPDPSSWLLMALIHWHAHKAQLNRISEQGLQTPDDHQLARAACVYVRTVLDKMRGVTLDFTQN